MVYEYDWGKFKESGWFKGKMYRRNCPQLLDQSLWTLRSMPVCVCFLVFLGGKRGVYLSVNWITYRKEKILVFTSNKLRSSFILDKAEYEFLISFKFLMIWKLWRLQMTEMCMVYMHVWSWIDARVTQGTW